MQRIVVYVDGFNLYHGMRARFGRAYHWLDLQSLASSLLRPGQRLEGVKYFTARVRGTGAGRLRQVAYLEALRAHCSKLEIIEGHFQEKNCRCRTCAATWTTYEEKETDVSLAVALVEDAAFARYGTALLVTADRDLCPAVRAVRRLSPAARVIAVFPPARASDQLKQAAHAVFWIGRDKLSRSQLPAKVVTPNGTELTRPVYWT